MDALDRFRMIRAELKEELRDKTLMSEGQLNFKDNDVDVEDYFYSLPQTPYVDKNGFVSFTYIVALEGTFFKLYDNETGECLHLEVDWVSTDAIAEFLELEPLISK